MSDATPQPIRTRRDVGAPEAQKDPIFLFQRKAKFGQWDTVYVFFTREEAEQYGRDFAYNFRSGWRVYCVTAMGELADVLRMPEKAADVQDRIDVAPRCGGCGKQSWAVRYTADGFRCTECLFGSTVQTNAPGDAYPHGDPLE